MTLSGARVLGYVELARLPLFVPRGYRVSRALRGGRGKEEPLSAIATVLQAAPGDDGLYRLPVPLGTPPLLNV